MRLSPGTVVGQYRITGFLGAGGMGEVYRARHVALGRDAALKTLPADKQEDAERNRRFLQEARSVSALQHPNIVGLYDIAEWNGYPYLAMEYVEGLTLEAFLARGRPALDETLRLAIQVARALSAAHRAGVLHRDIKPRNIMITSSGTAKVLDFGLAKRFRQHVAAPAANAETVTMESDTEPLTHEGHVVGTVAYMSPEQAEGRPLDARSDVFSFGSLLYEMLTGRRAFEGSSSASTLAKILREQPPEVSGISPEVPWEVEEVVRLCLRKRAEDRAESMHDVACMLEAAERRYHVPAEEAPGRRRRKWRIAAWLGIPALAAVGAISFWQWQTARGTVAEPELQRLTWDDGLNLFPTLSKDGRMLAFASDRQGEGSLDIFVRHIRGSEAVRLTRDPADDVEPDFAPDGRMIAFASRRKNGGIYTVPVLGGQERLLAPGGARPRYSPDGARIAYWAGDEGDLSSTARIYVVAASGGTPRQLQASFAYARSPIWTPDGAHLLFWGAQRAGEQPDWWVTPLADGPAVKTGALEQARRRALSTVYEPGGWADGRVIFSAREENRRSLYAIPISLRSFRAEGPPEALTFGTGTDGEPQTGARGRIIFTSLRYEINAWSRPMDGSGRIADSPDRKLTMGAAYHSSLSVSQDGTLLSFVHGRHPTANVGIRDLRSGEEVAATPDESDKCSAALRPDGQSVAWSVCGPGPESIFVADLSPVLVTGPPQKVCEDCGRVADWSRTGDRILFVDHSTPSRVGVLSVTTGETKVVGRPNLALESPRYSPDGKWAAVSGKRESRAAIYAIPLVEGYLAPEAEWVQVTDGLHRDEKPVWAAGGAALLFYSKRDGFGCVWRQAINRLTKKPEGAPEAVLEFHRGRFSMGDLSSPLLSLAGTARMLTFTLLESSGSIWLLNPTDVRRAD
jgi:Tol biopolymer transport system component